MATKVAPRRKKTTTRTPAKKTVAKTAGRKKTKTTTPVGGRKKKTTTKVTPKKKTTTKAKAKSTGTRGGFHRELDSTGMFVVGTDSSTIAGILLEGGESRGDINDIVAEEVGTETRNGTERNVPALVSGILNKLLEAGYTIDSSFVVVPPATKGRKSK